MTATDKLTPKELLILHKVALERYFELLAEKLQVHIDDFLLLDTLDQFYLRAYWDLLLQRLFEAVKDEPITLPATTIDALNIQMSVIDESFGTTLSVGSRCVDTVKMRLESTKRLVGDKFAKEFRDAVNKHDITSPIEQLFLLQWRYANLEARFNVDIEPQAVVTTPSGTYRVDYLITSKETGELGVGLVIELDGHEFHERTKEQVAHDNARTRALSRAGMTVLRFSGHEISGKSRDCMNEVAMSIELALTVRHPNAH